MSDFKIEELGYYIFEDGKIAEVVYIGNDIRLIGSISKFLEEDGLVIVVSKFHRGVDVLYYNKKGNMIKSDKPYKVGPNIVKYLGKECPFYVFFYGDGYYKNRAGDKVKVVHCSEYHYLNKDRCVLVINEQNGTYYYCTYQGISDKGTEFDLIEFVEH